MKKKMAFSMVISVMVILALLLTGCAKAPAETPTPGGTAQWHLEQGNKLFEQGSYDEAIEEYTTAIQLKPAAAAAYYNRGMAYYHLNQFERAIEDYDEAIRLNPQFANAYHNRGVAYRELGQFERAIEDYDEAIRLNPQHALAYYNRGLAYEAQGKKAEAIADYEKFIALSDNPELIEEARQWIAELTKPPTAPPAAPPEAPPIVTTGKSVYEGTYIGMFTYEYNEWTTRMEGGVEKFVYGKWVPAGFRLTVTFKHVVTEGGWTYLQVTNVICSDPLFGTGLAGITPLSGAAGLPADPPTTPMNPSLEGMGIAIAFPNMATLSTTSSAGSLSVGFDGATLSNSFDPSIQGKTWEAHTPEGTFKEFMLHLKYPIYRFKSWSLSKSFAP